MASISNIQENKNISIERRIATVINTKTQDGDNNTPIIDLPGRKVLDHDVRASSSHTFNNTKSTVGTKVTPIINPRGTKVLDDDANATNYSTSNKITTAAGNNDTQRRDDSGTKVLECPDISNTNYSASKNTKTTVVNKASNIDMEGMNKLDRQRMRCDTTISIDSMSSSTSTNQSLSISTSPVEQEEDILGSRLLETKHRRRWEVQESILDTIGQTPIVKLQRMAPAGVDVYVKVENSNPGGSSKDRLSIGIIEWAEKTGKLQPGQTVIEASSGNAGISFALVCAVKGYPFVCVVSESFSAERCKLMRVLGAKVIITKSQHMETGTVLKAQELANEHGYFYPKQFENEANAQIHEQTTGAEICSAFAKYGKRLDHFFTAYETGGTLLGVSRAFRQAKMSTEIHVCEPTSAPMLQSGIETEYPGEGEGATTSFASAHPAWSPHLLQGWATNFIPKLVAQAKDEAGYRSLAHVSSGAAIVCSIELAKKEGILTGISGGGILAAGLTFAKTCEPGTTILCILPESCERDISSLFENITVEMTPEELALSATTPDHAPSAMHTLPSDTDQLFDM